MPRMMNIGLHSFGNSRPGNFGQNEIKTIFIFKTNQNFQPNLGNSAVSDHKNDHEREDETTS